LKTSNKTGYTINVMTEIVIMYCFQNFDSNTSL